VMLEECLDEVDASIAEIKRKFYGVTTGRVINLLDPLMLGRVQVQMPFIDALDLSPWARIAMPMAGILHGTYFIPNIGDEVLIAFEHGDVNAPYVLGSLWTAAAPPPQQSPLPQIRELRTLAGNQIVFTEVPPSVTIQTGPTSPVPAPTPPSPGGPHHTVMLSPAGIQAMTPTSILLQVGATTLLMTPESITIQAAGNIVTINAGGVNIVSPANINVTAGGSAAVTAPLVRINS